MNKKSCFLIPGLFFVLAIWPCGLAGQDAGDIIVPDGYKVEKIAETNKVSDPQSLVFDSAGNLVVEGMSFLIYKIDSTGRVEVIGKTRRYNLTPKDLALAPDGTCIVVLNIVDTSIVSGIYRFVAPDTYTKVIDAISVPSIRFDNYGNFYASIKKSSADPRQIIRYNADFQEADILLSTRAYAPWDIAFDSANNLYYVEPCDTGGNTGQVWKIPAGSDGIPGSDDTPEVFASGLEDPAQIALDAAGNLYVSEFDHYRIDGFSSFYMSKIKKIGPTGVVLGGIAGNLANVMGLVCKDNDLYVSEFDRAVVSRIDLTTLAKSDFTRDYGMGPATNINFDSNDTLYSIDFRQMRLTRLNSNGQFSQVGQGIGYAQSIASDGAHFYLGSSDVATGNEYQILKIDPIAETTEVKATHVRGWRSVVFDSYGRLILNSILSQTDFGLDIIDLTSGSSTPYVVGLHNKARCIQFDARQNLYTVEGVGDGIKKVLLDRDYDPPRDISSEPLFYDFRSEPYPPAIYFFTVNQLEEVFIPRMESGEVLLGDANGNVQAFAQGFLYPAYVNFNKYGELFVSDMSNGLFKITHQRWTIPAVVILKDKLLEEVRASAIPEGIKNSLVKKLENADKDLEKAHVRPAINKIQAFINEIKAQRDKAIPITLADGWTDQATKIIKALEEVEY